ncbi:NmrA/HSCARG family protein [Neorhizobium sp. DT-125]|uniref:NmrA/HSCARG family protein n=1 Tax=Neorhizobium sp. DT-125 TaxID=3396163 RepID=UPI003F1B04C8
MGEGRSALVLGATGQQGGAVARALDARGWVVRALVRDPQGRKAEALAAEGIELRHGDLADPNSIRAAMSGVEAVFSVQPSSGQGAAHGVSDEQEVVWGKTVADLAKASGVGHLVYSSVGAAGKGVTGMGHFDSKTEIEDHIRRLDLQYTIVRPSSFMEMLMLPGMGLDQGEFNFLMRPDQAMQVIAVDDIGKIVAAILNIPELYAGRTLEIAGDEVTGLDLQDALSRAARQPITYKRFPDSLLAENRFLGRLAELVDDGRCAGSADINALRQEFGDLMTLEAWLAGPGKPLLQNALLAPWRLWRFADLRR